MGADGGLEWVRVNDRERFGELTTHLYLAGCDWREEHDDLLEEIRAWPEDWVVCSYSNTYDPDLMTLETLVGIVKDHLEPWPECNPDPRFPDAPPLVAWLGDTTWRDVPLDLATIPSNQTPSFEARFLKYQFNRELENHPSNPVLDMTLREWSLAMAETVDLGSYGSEETWT